MEAFFYLEELEVDRERGLGMGEVSDRSYPTAPECTWALTLPKVISC